MFLIQNYWDPPIPPCLLTYTHVRRYSFKGLIVSLLSRSAHRGWGGGGREGRVPPKYIYIYHWKREGGGEASGARAPHIFAWGGGGGGNGMFMPPHFYFSLELYVYIRLTYN